MTYQFNPNSPADTCFLPGDLKYLIPGNEGRWLDPRRTPLRVLDVRRSSGFFVVELLDFEDKGARWELPLERVNRCQFARGSAEASAAEVELYSEIVARLNRPLAIPADPSCRAQSEATIASLRKEVGAWMDTKSTFVASGARLAFTDRTGSALLWTDLDRYMLANGLGDIEGAFAEQYVRNPESGELVKGHRILLAELGLVSFAGTQVRDPDLFAGPWSRPRRADHILHRLAFVREVFDRLGPSPVVLYRGLSCHGSPGVRENSFVSATFSLDVAMSHFHNRDSTSTGVLLRQPVPTARLFMTYQETAQMNRHYKEAEAVLLRDPTNEIF